MPAQVDLLERMTRVIVRVNEARRGDGDLVEYATSIVPLYSECEQGHVDFEFHLAVLLRVYCPEIETTLIQNKMLEIGSDEESLAAHVNRWWDDITIERLGDAMAAEEEDEAGKS